jgi:hypothetical protein
MRAAPLTAKALDLDRLEQLLRELPSPEGNAHKLQAVHAYQSALLRGVACGRFTQRFERSN